MGLICILGSGRCGVVNANAFAYTWIKGGCYGDHGTVFTTAVSEDGILFGTPVILGDASFTSVGLLVTKLASTA